MPFITAERIFNTCTLQGSGISVAGITALKRFEGKSLKSYPDPPGQKNLYSIGYGHQIQANEPELFYGITDQKAESLLVKDLAKFIAVVNDTIKAPVNQNQFDALVSLAYNIGETRFRNSELVKKINSSAPINSITDWWKSHYITAGGLPSDSLRKRRAAEALNYSSDQKESSFYKAGSGTISIPIWVYPVALIVIYKVATRKKKKVA